MDLYRRTLQLLGEPSPPEPVEPSQFVILQDRVGELANEALAACDLTTVDGSLFAAVIVSGRDSVLRKLEARARAEQRSKPSTRSKST